VRAGARFVVLSMADCPRAAERCATFTRIESDGRASGEHRSFHVGIAGMRPIVDGDSLMFVAGSDDGSSLERFDGERLERILEIPAERDVLAVAIDGDRWAVIAQEHERRLLFASTLSAPVELRLPLPRVPRAPMIDLRFAGDHLQLAGRANRDAIEAPAWIVDVGLDGSLRGTPMRLAAVDTFVGNRVGATVDSRRRFSRRDSLGRPIGEELELPQHGTAIAGDGRRFVAVDRLLTNEVRALTIECEQGNVPRPSPRVPFEGLPDPTDPCGAVACAPSAPSMAGLLSTVSRKCDRLAFGDGPPPAGRDASGDSVSVELQRRTDQAGVVEVAAVHCARVLDYMGTMGRWAFLAMRTDAGWSACELGGQRASLFDIEVDVRDIRVEPWIEGDPPEVTARFRIEDNASDAGEISGWSGDELHVCGVEAGQAVCWGSITLEWTSADGPSGHVHRRSGGNRVEPDGRGYVTLTPRDDRPTVRRDVRHLRPGCP
jgi:hypothetical protein